MKRKIPALLLALLLVFSAALPAGAAGYRCAVRSWPPDCWKQSFCDRFGIGCGNQTPGAPSEPEQPSEPEEPSEPSGGASVSSYGQQVAALVNAERAKYGLAALTLDETLCGYARVKSQDMHDQGYFSHTSPTYGSPFDMMRSFGVSYRSAGENIAMGYYAGSRCGRLDELRGPPREHPVRELYNARCRLRRRRRVLDPVVHRLTRHPYYR